MDEPIAVHPVEGDADYDSWTIRCSMRVLVLDAATGRPLAGAYAEKPAVEQKVLNERGVHPFRVLKTRDVTLDHGDFDSFTYPVTDLRTYVLDGDNALKLTWNSTAECIQAPEREEVLQGEGGALFQRIAGADKRYIMVHDGNEELAKRDLITNTDGILDIPITWQEWLKGTTVTVKLRDFRILEAKDDFSVADLLRRETSAGGAASLNGYRALKVTLHGDCVDNDWRAKPGATEGKFEEELDLDKSWASFEDIDAVVWAVCRSGPCTDLVDEAVLTSSTRECSCEGIMIHFNSGYNMTEVRGTAKRLSREAFTAGENDYMMRVETALWILRRIADLINVSSLGYQYHISREGHIYRCSDDDVRMSHAGYSREASPVTAVQPWEPGDLGPPQTAEHTFTSRKTSLNVSYIGIDLLGSHNAGYHFTESQLWYLDRLIENLMDEYDDIEWYRIQGHDEVRKAWNDAFADKPVKNDPGAALAGGMDGLRGRHGAPLNGE